MNSRTDDVVLDEKTHAPILVVRDRWTKHLFAHVLPYKGVTKGPIWIQGTPERHQETRIFQTGHST